MAQFLHKLKVARSPKPANTCALVGGTHQLFNFALVDVRANLSGLVHFETWVAYASVGSDHVFAGAVLADVGVLGALVDVVAVEGGAGSVGAQQVEVGGAGHRTGLAARAPAHWLTGHHRAATATRFGDRRRGWVEAQSIPVLLVAQVPPRVQTRPPIRTQTGI